MNDAEILQWIAYYVMDITSFQSDRGRETIQITACDGPARVVVMRTGKSHLDALRKCVRAAAKKLPLRKHNRTL